MTTPNGHTYHAGKTPAMAAQEEVQRALECIVTFGEDGRRQAVPHLGVALEHLAVLVERDRKLGNEEGDDFDPCAELLEIIFRAREIALGMEPAVDAQRVTALLAGALDEIQAHFAGGEPLPECPCSRCTRERKELAP